MNQIKPACDAGGAGPRPNDLTPDSVRRFLKVAPIGFISPADEQLDRIERAVDQLNNQTRNLLSRVSQIPQIVETLPNKKEIIP